MCGSVSPNLHGPSTAQPPPISSISWSATCASGMKPKGSCAFTSQPACRMSRWEKLRPSREKPSNATPAALRRLTHHSAAASRRRDARRRFFFAPTSRSAIRLRHDHGLGRICTSATVSATEHRLVGSPRSCSPTQVRGLGAAYRCGAARHHRVHRDRSRQAESTTVPHRPAFPGTCAAVRRLVPRLEHARSRRRRDCRCGGKGTSPARG